MNDDENVGDKCTAMLWAYGSVPLALPPRHAHDDDTCDEARVAFMRRIMMIIMIAAASAKPEAARHTVTRAQLYLRHRAVAACGASRRIISRRIHRRIVHSDLFLVDDRIDSVRELCAVSESIVRELLSDRAGLIAQLVAWQSDAYYCIMRS